MIGLMAALLFQGWVFGGTNVAGDSEYYFMPGPSESMVWMRSELPDDGGARSFRSLWEADCGTHRMRMVQGYSFRRPNLEDPMSQLQPIDWMYPEPGTVNEGIYLRICAP